MTGASARSPGMSRHGPARQRRRSSVRGRLRSPLAGEDALLVAVDAHHAGSGREVGEVPDVLADDGVEAVEDAVEHREQLGLILLRPRVGHDVVQPGSVSAPYSVKMIGLS